MSSPVSPTPSLLLSSGDDHSNSVCVSCYLAGDLRFDERHKQVSLSNIRVPHPLGKLLRHLLQGCILLPTVTISGPKSYFHMVLLQGDGDSGQEVQGGAVPDPTEESTSTTSPEQPRMSSLSQEEEEEITAALDSEIKELKEANRLMNPAQLKAWVLQVQEEYHNAQQAQEASGEQEVHELNLDEPRTVSFAGMPFNYCPLRYRHF